MPGASPPPNPGLSSRPRAQPKGRALHLIRYSPESFVVPSEVRDLQFAGTGTTRTMPVPSAASPVIHADISQTPSDRPHRHRTTLNATLEMNCARLQRRTSQPPSLTTRNFKHLWPKTPPKPLQKPAKSMIQPFKSFLFWVV